MDITPWGEHFCIVGDQYEGPGARAIKCCHKTPIAIPADDGSVRRVAMRALGEMIRALPDAITTTISMADVMLVVGRSLRRGGNANAVQGDRNAWELALSEYPTANDVMVAKAYLCGQGAVVSTIDKRSGMVAIM